MPHLFVNRPRQHDLIETDPSLEDHFRWETVNAVTYQVGGLFFIAGSIFFFPALHGYAALGARIFILGSLFYFLVTAHDMAEVVKHRRIHAVRPTVSDKLEVWAASAYIAGTLMFVAGSIFLQPEIGLPVAAARCHVVGAFFFVVGATINVLQIVRAANRLTLQLMNLTALTFVAGSLLFTVASIPYLWKFANLSSRDTVHAFLALQYLLGSALFFLGGVFNYWRAYIVHQHEVARRGQQTAPPAASAQK